MSTQEYIRHLRGWLGQVHKRYTGKEVYTIKDTWKQYWGRQRGWVGSTAELVGPKLVVKRVNATPSIYTGTILMAPLSVRLLIFDAKTSRALHQRTRSNGYVLIDNITYKGKVIVNTRTPIPKALKVLEGLEKKLGGKRHQTKKVPMRGTKRNYVNLETINAFRRPLVEQGIENFMDAAGITNATNRETFRNSIDKATARDFQQAIDRCINWFKLKLRGRRKYMLVLDGRPPSNNHLAKMKKSSRWLAHVVTAALGRPEHVFYVGHPANFRKHTNVAKKIITPALIDGSVFLHLDDAVYTGNQKSEIFDFINALAEAVNPKFEFYMAAAYATQHGTQRIQESLQENQEFYHDRDLRPMPLSQAFLNKYNLTIEDPGTTMSLMPHKVANSVSFGVSTGKAGWLGTKLTNRLNKETIYKR